MSVEIKQLSGSFVSPKDDAVLHRIFHCGHGIVRGCELTYPGGNQIAVAAGYAYIHGRMLEISEETITCTLPSSTTAGEVILKIDMEASTPAYLLARAPQEALTQEDINSSGTVYEMQLATFTASNIALSDLTVTYTTLTSAITQSEVGNIFSEEVSYEEGEYCSYENELYKFTAAHPAGAWLGTDVEKVVILDELTACTALQSDVDTLKTKRYYETTLANNTYITSTEDIGRCLYTTDDGAVYYTLHRLHIYAYYSAANRTMATLDSTTNIRIIRMSATRESQALMTNTNDYVLDLTAAMRYRPTTGAISTVTAGYRIQVEVDYIDLSEEPLAA
ncbi:MAG: hypothetical protein LUE31_03040 [Lachnospiraceae bacterium]|nr:hypothetical protein [Lachnospiraceae bacterium]